MKHSNTLMYGAIIYSLFVGAIYSTFAIIGLLTRWCVIKTQSSPLLYMLYLFYFRVEKCEPRIQWLKLNINYVDVIMPNETRAARRTYIFLIFYLVLHLALIASALLAWCGTKRSAGRKARAFSATPLVFIIIATVVLDAIATVFYIVDFSSSMKLDGLMNILEVKNMDQVRDNFQQLPYTARYVPPVIMFLITSKLFIFLICNIIWAVLIVYKSCARSKQKHDAMNESKTSQDTTLSANDNPAFEHEMSVEKSPKLDNSYVGMSEDRYNDTSRVKDFIYPHHVYSTSKKHKTDEILDDDSIDFRIQRPVLTASYYNNDTDARLSKLQQYPNNNSNGYEKDIENRFNRFHKSNGNREYEEITATMDFREVKLRPTPPPKPNRHEVHIRPSSSYYLHSTGHEDSIVYRPPSVMSDSKTDRSSGPIKTPQELRSQLPWSYFKSSDNVPRHALVHTDDNEIPGIPQPDYEISVTKKRRAFDK